MISLQLLQNRKIIKLITRLKAETPDYPSHLMVTRKADFIKQVAAINVSGITQGNWIDINGGSSEVVGVLNSLSTAQGILLQVVIGVWIIAAMLTVAYVFRNQIVDLLQQNNIILVESTQVGPVATDISTSPTIVTPSPELSPTSITPTVVEPNLTDSSNDSSSAENPPDTPSDSSKNDPGLHLGQTPGPPNPPGQDKQEKK